MFVLFMKMFVIDLLMCVRSGLKVGFRCGCVLGVVGVVMVCFVFWGWMMNECVML